MAKKGAVRVTVLGTADMRQIAAARQELNKLEAAVKKNQPTMTRTQRAMQGVTSTLKNMGPGLLIAGAAAVALGAKLVQMGEEGLQAQARLDNITKSMGLFGGEASAVSERLGDLADTQARATGIDDDAILATQAKLMTFRELAKTADEVGGAFDRTTTAALDLAAAGFGEATQNAVQLGKALNDPVKGLTALSRAGITFTEDEKEKIKVLVESGKMLEAQDTLLRAIETQVGGTAEATATATARMQVAWSQVGEEIGKEFVPVLNDVADGLNSLFSEKTPNSEYVRQTMGFVQVKEWRENVKDAERETALLTSRLKGMRGAAAGLSPEMQGAADATGEASAEMDELTRSMEGTMVASDELSGKVRTLSEMNLDVQESAIRVRDAEARAAEMLREHGDASDEYKSAVIDLERAKYRSLDATADLRTAEVEHGGTLQELAKQDEYEEHLLRIRDAAIKAATAIGSAKRSSQAKWGRTGTQSGGGVMQYGAGGLVSSPTYAMVGERGHDEYVVTTEPAYRSRSLALFESLGKDLGVTNSTSSQVFDFRGAQFGSGLTRPMVQGWMEEVLRGKVRTSNAIGSF